MKISIVIATFNSGKTLTQTLDSIRYQTYKDLEVIVIDGKSTDNTLHIIEEYSDIVSKFISEKDSGIYNAFNKGISLATGEYICFIGSDDCYCNYNVFRIVADELSSNKEMYSFPIIIVNNQLLCDNYCPNRYTKKEVLLGSMIPHQGLITRTDVMRKYRFNEDNKIISDYEFLVRYLIDGGEVYFSDVPIVYFSDGGISDCGIGSKNWVDMLSERILMLHRLGLEKYTLAQIKTSFPFENMNKLSYHLRCIRRIIRRSLGISDEYKRYLRFWKRHRCNLKICRWCNRKGIH